QSFLSLDETQRMIVLRAVSDLIRETGDITLVKEQTRKWMDSLKLEDELEEVWKNRLDFKINDVIGIDGIPVIELVMVGKDGLITQAYIGMKKAGSPVYYKNSQKIVRAKARKIMSSAREVRASLDESSRSLLEGILNERMAKATLLGLKPVAEIDIPEGSQENLREILRRINPGVSLEKIGGSYYIIDMISTMRAMSLSNRQFSNPNDRPFKSSREFYEAQAVDIVHSQLQSIIGGEAKFFIEGSDLAIINAFMTPEGPISAASTVYDGILQEVVESAEYEAPVTQVEVSREKAPAATKRMSGLKRAIPFIAGGAMIAIPAILAIAGVITVIPAAAIATLGALGIALFMILRSGGKDDLIDTVPITPISSDPGRGAAELQVKQTDERLLVAEDQLTKETVSVESEKPGIRLGSEGRQEAGNLEILASQISGELVKLGVPAVEASSLFKEIARILEEEQKQDQKWRKVFENLLEELRKADKLDRAIISNFGGVIAGLDRSIGKTRNSKTKIKKSKQVIENLVFLLTDEKLHNFISSSMDLDAIRLDGVADGLYGVATHVLNSRRMTAKDQAKNELAAAGNILKELGFIGFTARRIGTPLTSGNSVEDSAGKTIAEWDGLTENQIIEIKNRTRSFKRASYLTRDRDGGYLARIERVFGSASAREDLASDIGERGEEIVSKLGDKSKPINLTLVLDPAYALKNFFSQHQRFAKNLDLLKAVFVINEKTMSAENINERKKIQRDLVATLYHFPEVAIWLTEILGPEFEKDFYRAFSELLAENIEREPVYWVDTDLQHLKYKYNLSYFIAPEYNYGDEFDTSRYSGPITFDDVQSLYQKGLTGARKLIAEDEESETELSIVRLGSEGHQEAAEAPAVEKVLITAGEGVQKEKDITTSVLDADKVVSALKLAENNREEISLSKEEGVNFIQKSYPTDKATRLFVPRVKSAELSGKSVYEVVEAGIALINVSKHQEAVVVTRNLETCTGVGIRAVDGNGDVLCGIAHLYFPSPEHTKTAGDLSAEMTSIHNDLIKAGLSNIEYFVSYNPEVHEKDRHDLQAIQRFENEIRKGFPSARIAFHQRTYRSALGIEIEDLDALVVSPDGVTLVPEKSKDKTIVYSWEREAKGIEVVKDDTDLGEQEKTEVIGVEESLPEKAKPAIRLGSEGRQEAAADKKNTFSIPEYLKDVSRLTYGGTTANLYLVTDTRDDKQKVLKVFNPESRYMAEAEYERLKELSDIEGVVNQYQLYKVGDKPVAILMEYVDGIDIEKSLEVKEFSEKEKRIFWKELHDIAKEIAKRGILIGDLNVLVVNSRPKIIDLSDYQKADGSVNSIDNNRLAVDIVRSSVDSDFVPSDFEDFDVLQGEVKPQKIIRLGSEGRQEAAAVQQDDGLLLDEMVQKSPLHNGHKQKLYEDIESGRFQNLSQLEAEMKKLQRVERFMKEKIRSISMEVYSEDDRPIDPYHELEKILGEMKIENLKDFKKKAKETVKDQLELWKSNNLNDISGESILDVPDNWEGLLTGQYSDESDFGIDFVRSADELARQAEDEMFVSQVRTATEDHLVLKWHSIEYNQKLSVSDENAHRVYIATDEKNHLKMVDFILEAVREYGKGKFKYIAVNNKGIFEAAPRDIPKLAFYFNNEVEARGFYEFLIAREGWKDLESSVKNALLKYFKIEDLYRMASKPLGKSPIVSHGTGMAETRVTDYGRAMKQIGIRPLQNEDSVKVTDRLRAEWEEKAKEITHEKRHGIKAKFIPVNNLPQGLYGYHFKDTDGTIIIVTSSEFQDEAAYHETKEAAWIEKLVARAGPEISREEILHQAHILASAEQVIKFSKNGELTPFHQVQLNQMTANQLQKIAAEDRSYHHGVIEKYLGKDTDKSQTIIAYEDQLKKDAKEQLAAQKASPEPTRRIKYYGSSVLRKKSESIDVITENERQLFNSMGRIVKDKTAYGLAAPQIGINKRMIVINYDGNLMKLANPQIIKAEGKKSTGLEGCLSLLGMALPVKRYREVVVTALNENNEEITINASGELARILQHEIDHLDGKLIVDYSPFWLIPFSITLGTLFIGPVLLTSMIV
ncbi:peptide deformylase, partial [Elusimicrobiota bacterium]